jgi:hypothetical protein
MDWTTTREIQDIEYFTSLENDIKRDAEQKKIEEIKKEIPEEPDIKLTINEMREMRIRSLSKK